MLTKVNYINYQIFFQLIKKKPTVNHLMMGAHHEWSSGRNTVPLSDYNLSINFHAFLIRFSIGTECKLD